MANTLSSLRDLEKKYLATPGTCTTGDALHSAAHSKSAGLSSLRNVKRGVEKVPAQPGGRTR